MRYSEVIKELTVNQNKKAARSCWRDMYIYPKFKGYDNNHFLIDKTLRLEGIIECSCMHYIPSHSDVVANDWYVFT